MSRHEEPSGPRPVGRSGGVAGALDRWGHSAPGRWLAAAGRELVGLLVPTSCVVCSVADGTVCAGCRPGLAAELLHPFRAEGHAAALPLVRWPEEAAAPGEPTPLPVLAAARYGEGTASALLAFKDHGRITVGHLLRPAVHRAVAAATGGLELTGPGILVPIPGSAGGFRRRGYDPVAELLTGPLPPGWRVTTGWLGHRSTLPRPGLPGAVSAAAGGAAVSHAGAGVRVRRTRSRDRFRVRSRALAAVGGPGGPIVLFDDVMTTGATLAAAWRALDSAGLTPSAAIVLAAVAAPDEGPDEGPRGGPQEGQGTKDRRGS